MLIIFKKFGPFRTFLFNSEADLSGRSRSLSDLLESYKTEISAGWQGWIPEGDEDERLALGAEAVDPAAHHHPLPAVSRSPAYLDPPQTTYFSHPIYP